MKASQVYSQYQIPKNLQRHMLRVASVGKYISKNWKGTVDEHAIVSTLLLHDLGNLLKFNLHRGLELFDEDERNLDVWLKIQNSLKEEYSSDEHEATLLMAREIEVNDRVLDLLNNMGSSNLHTTVKKNDWELAIVSYSDFRVDPDGFATVQERFADILKRYNGGDHVLADKEKTFFKRDQCLELEKQIQSKIKVSLNDLPTEELEEVSKSLRDWEL